MCPRPPPSAVDAGAMQDGVESQRAPFSILGGFHRQVYAPQAARQGLWAPVSGLWVSAVQLGHAGCTHQSFSREVAPGTCSKERKAAAPLTTYPVSGLNDCDAKVWATPKQLPRAAETGDSGPNDNHIKFGLDHMGEASIVGCAKHRPRVPGRGHTFMPHSCGVDHSCGWRWAGWLVCKECLYYQCTVSQARQQSLLLPGEGGVRYVLLAAVQQYYRYRS